MIETSKDLLYIVIAFCILWFTIFLCWMLYYIAMILRQANKMIKDWRERISRIEEFFASLKGKFENVGPILEGAKKVIGFIKEREEKKTKRKKKK